MLLLERTHKKLLLRLGCWTWCCDERKVLQRYLSVDDTAKTWLLDLVL